MAGLVPAIYVFLSFRRCKTWMPGTRPGMTSQVKFGSTPGLARGDIERPPRANVSGELVIAGHHVERHATAGVGHLDAHVARLLASFRRKPGAVVAPQARSLGALVRRPGRRID